MRNYFFPPPIYFIFHKLQNNPVPPAGRQRNTHRYWNTACCFEQEGWSMGISAILRCLPSR